MAGRGPAGAGQGQGARLEGPRGTPWRFAGRARSAMRSACCHRACRPPIPIPRARPRRRPGRARPSSRPMPSRTSSPRGCYEAPRGQRAALAGCPRATRRARRDRDRRRHDGAARPRRHRAVAADGAARGHGRAPVRRSAAVLGAPDRRSLDDDHRGVPQRQPIARDRGLPGMRERAGIGLRSLRPRRSRRPRTGSPPRGREAPAAAADHRPRREGPGQGPARGRAVQLQVRRGPPGRERRMSRPTAPRKRRRRWWRQRRRERLHPEPQGPVRDLRRNATGSPERCLCPKTGQYQCCASGSKFTCCG